MAICVCVCGGGGGGGGLGWRGGEGIGHSQVVFGGFFVGGGGGVTFKTDNFFWCIKILSIF